MAFPNILTNEVVAHAQQQTETAHGRLKMRITRGILHGIVFGIWLISVGRTQEPASNNRGGPEGPNRLGAVKITCTERGIHRILGEQLIDLGIRLHDLHEDIDLGRVALVHQNESVPFCILGLRDGRFDPDDSMFFFAEGINHETQPYINLNRIYHPPSQSFMLHLDPSPYKPIYFHGRAMKTPAVDDPVQYPLYPAQGRLRFEQDPIWEVVSPRDKGSAADAKETGEDFLFWKKLTNPNTDKSSNTAMLPFALPALVDGAEHQIDIRLVAVGNDKVDWERLEHRIGAELNGQFTSLIEWKHPHVTTARIHIPAGVLHSGANKLKLTLHPPRSIDIPSIEAQRRINLDTVMVDWFEVRFRQYTSVQRDYGEYYIDEKAEERIPFRIDNFSRKRIQVFDLGANEVYTVKSFRENNTHTFGVNLMVKPGKTVLVAFNLSQARRPYRLERVFPLGLFQQPVDCDMLILTHGDFKKALLPFIEWKQNRGLKVHMVDIADIYNERTAGYANCQALRDYVEHVYSSQPEPKLKYLLLVGDSSIVSKYKTFLPAYSYLQSGKPADDNFYANFEDVEKPPVLAVGRFPVTDSYQLRNVIQKIIHYESAESAGPWRSRFLVIAASSFWAMKDAYYMIENFIRPHYLANLVKTKSQDATAEHHQALTQSIVDQLDAGSLITIFFGHGGGTVWEVGPAMGQKFFRAHLFDQENVKGLTNHDRPTLVFALTCYTNNFDDPHFTQTLGETFVNSPGGAIGVIGASRRSHPDINLSYLQEMIRLFKQNKFDRLGDCFVSAKQNVRKSVPYILLGDPSLEFRLPRTELVLSDAVFDARDRVIKLNYELPADVACPAELRVSLLVRRKKLLAEWTQLVEEPKGKLQFHIEHEGTGQYLHVVGYVAGVGHQTYSGGVSVARDARLSAR